MGRFFQKTIVSRPLSPPWLRTKISCLFLWPSVEFTSEDSHDPKRYFWGSQEGRLWTGLYPSSWDWLLCQTLSSWGAELSERHWSFYLHPEELLFHSSQGMRNSGDWVSLNHKETKKMCPYWSVLVLCWFVGNRLLILNPWLQGWSFLLQLPGFLNWVQSIIYGNIYIYIYIYIHIYIYYIYVIYLYI